MGVVGLRLLVVSDLHYNLRQFDWLLGRAGGFDYVVLAGDVLDVGGFLDLDVQITVVSEYLARLGECCRVIVCSGNHDGEGRNEAGEHVACWLRGVRSERVLVDGDWFRDGGVLFSVCPWWDGPESRDEMVGMLEEHSGLERECWVWVHHAPPDGCRVSWTGRRFGGDRFLNGLIGRFSPDVVFSGHIHNAPFYGEGGWVDRLDGAWVCNPGSQPGGVPSCIEFDLGLGGMRAVFCSLEERLEAVLSGRGELSFVR